MKIKLPSNEIILYVLALGGALTFAYAFLVIDAASLTSVNGIILLLRGLVIGAAAGLGIAKISHALPRIKSKGAQRLTAVAFGVMLAVAVPIVASVTYAKMSPEMTALPQWVRVVVSVAVALFVDALTAGVAVSSGKLEADDKPAQSETPAEPKPAKAKDKPGFVCSCGYVAKTQAGLNGHKRKHSKVVGYVASFEPVKAEQVSK